MNDTLQIVLALFGGGAVTTLITFFVNRKDKKDDKLRELEEKISKGLDERELTGKNRYLEHKEAILDLKTSHEEDYKNLFQALEQLTSNVQANQQTIEIIGEGLMGMIHNTILYTTEPLIKRNGVTYEEIATIEGLYGPYKKLGGNGDCERRFEDIKKLPRISKEEAKRRDEKNKKAPSA